MYVGLYLCLSIYLYFTIFSPSLRPSHLCKVLRRIWYTYFYFYRLKFVIFFFSIFWCLCKKFFSTSIIKILKIFYEFSNFITFRPLIHLELIFVYSMCCGSNFSPHIANQVFSGWLIYVITSFIYYIPLDWSNFKTCICFWFKYFIPSVWWIVIITILL